MAAEDDSNGVWHGDTEGHCSTFIASSVREFALQKAGMGAPGNTKVCRFFTAQMFLIANDKMLSKN